MNVTSTETILCQNCGHKNNPQLSSCFKCNKKVDKSHLVVNIPYHKGWFKFIRFANTVGIVMFFIAGIMFVFFAQPISFVISIILGVVLLKLEGGLKNYEKSARENYIAFLFIGSSIFWFIHFPLLPITVLLIYAIAINEDNVNYYKLLAS